MTYNQPVVTVSGTGLPQSIVLDVANETAAFALPENPLLGLELSLGALTKSEAADGTSASGSAALLHVRLFLVNALTPDPVRRHRHRRGRPRPDGGPCRCPARWHHLRRPVRHDATRRGRDHLPGRRQHHTGHHAHDLGHRCRAGLDGHGAWLDGTILCTDTTVGSDGTWSCTPDQIRCPRVTTPSAPPRPTSRRQHLGPFRTGRRHHRPDRPRARVSNSPPTARPPATPPRPRRGTAEPGSSIVVTRGRRHGLHRDRVHQRHLVLHAHVVWPRVSTRSTAVADGRGRQQSDADSVTFTVDDTTPRRRGHHGSRRQVLDDRSTPRRPCPAPPTPARPSRRHATDGTPVCVHGRHDGTAGPARRHHAARRGCAHLRRHGRRGRGRQHLAPTRSPSPSPRPGAGRHDGAGCPGDHRTGRREHHDRHHAHRSAAPPSPARRSP